jgi:hypothetical protein
MAGFYNNSRHTIKASGMTTPLLLMTTVMAALLPRAAEAAGDPPPFSCGPPSAEATQGYAFCDARLPPAQRAADLVSRMTAAEKVAQLGDVAPGVPRLGVPAYKWWNEALHGLANSGKGLHFTGAVRAATSFPQVLLTAAAFDDDLWLRIGQVWYGINTNLCWLHQAVGAFDAPTISIRACMCVLSTRTQSRSCTRRAFSLFFVRWDDP